MVLIQVMVLACVMVLTRVMVLAVSCPLGGVTRPERPKGAKDEVKRPEGPLARSRGPEAYLIFVTSINSGASVKKID